MRKLSRRGLTASALLFAIIVASAGCSPEYTRARGGGPGADVGNRVLGPSVDIHGTVNPQFGEPAVGQAVQRQAK